MENDAILFGYALTVSAPVSIALGIYFGIVPGCVLASALMFVFLLFHLMGT